MPPRNSQRWIMVKIFVLVGTLVVLLLPTVHADEEIPRVAVSNPASVAQSVDTADDFNPSLRLLGVQSNPTEIEWVVIVDNLGTDPGRNVLLRSNLPAPLRVNNVRIGTGTTSIDGQSVQVTLPQLEAGETVQFSIFTNTPGSEVVRTTMCVTATNFNGTECAYALPIQALPATGETPLRQRIRLLASATFALSLMLIGGGLLAYQYFYD